MDADAATAEALITDQLAGKTYTQVMRQAEQAALTVRPGGSPNAAASMPRRKTRGKLASAIAHSGGYFALRVRVVRHASD